MTNIHEVQQVLTKKPKSHTFYLKPLILKGRERNFRKWGGGGKQTERILHQIVYRINEQEVLKIKRCWKAELQLKRESVYVACACVYVTSFAPLQN